MANGREKNKEKSKEMSLEYAKGYKDALHDTWEEIMKMTIKGYTSQELQIVAKSKAYSSQKKIEQVVAEIETEIAKEASPEKLAPLPLIGDENAEPVRVVNMKPSTSYLVKEDKPARCFEMFQKEVAGGRPGLCIARTTPTQIRDRYDIGNTQILWLTMSEKTDDHLPPSALGLGVYASKDVHGLEDEYISPSDLPKLFAFFMNFLDGHNNGIILFEGIEFLTSHNDFQQILRFINRINDKISEHPATLIISVNPKALESREYSLLERDMGVVV